MVTPHPGHCPTCHQDGEGERSPGMGCAGAELVEMSLLTAGVALGAWGRSLQHNPSVVP